MRVPDLITGGCEPPHSCKDLNSGPLEEKSVLLTPEPSFQPLSIGLLMRQRKKRCGFGFVGRWEGYGGVEKEKLINICCMNKATFNRKQIKPTNQLNKQEMLLFYQTQIRVPIPTSCDSQRPVCPAPGRFKPLLLASEGTCIYIHKHSHMDVHAF